MDRRRTATAFALVAACTLLAAPAPRAAEPPSPAASPAFARPHKSVYGTLSSVDMSLRAVVMRNESGERMTWRFRPEIVAKAALHKEGTPIVVIYRQTAANEKRVTALAFPGTAAVPTYINLTGTRVVLRSSAMVGEACGESAGVVGESTIPVGGRAEVNAGCWCCAPAGYGCIPSTKSGAGEAFLERCFESDQ